MIGSQPPSMTGGDAGPSTASSGGSVSGVTISTGGKGKTAVENLSGVLLAMLALAAFFLFMKKKG